MFLASSKRMTSSSASSSAASSASLITFDNDGQLVASANPWAAIFVADLRALEALEGAAELVAGVAARPASTFQPYFIEIFCRLDLTELRARELAHEYVAEPRPPDPPSVVDDDEPTCTCEVCGAVFAGARRLSMHRVAKHGIVHRARALVKCNKCFVCAQLFSTVEGAKRHVASSFALGMCACRGWGRSYALVGDVLSCASCGEAFETEPDCGFHLLAFHNQPALARASGPDLDVALGGDSSE